MLAMFKAILYTSFIKSRNKPTRENIMNKFEAIYLVVKKVAEELNVTLIEAASKMQTQAAKKNNEELITDLHNFKMKVAGL